MKICFLLPGFSNVPIGGYRVVFEHANRLANLGHECTIAYLWFLPGAKGRAAIRRLVRTPLSELLRPRVTWFSLKPTVQQVRWDHLNPTNLRSFDAVVATSWETAEALGQRSLAQRSFYLIQGYETWSGSSARVEATWHLPLTKIVVSTWLAGLGHQMGLDDLIIVPNGVDTEQFRMITPCEKKDPHRIATMWNPHPAKNAATALRALELVRKQVPELQVTVFSVSWRPSSVPEWMGYEYRPTPDEHSQLLDRSSIFVTTSLSEGWGLPATEAMASGCALVAGDIPGIKDYAIDGETAFLVPPADASAVARAIIGILRDDEQRIAVARRGHDLVTTKFTWDDATAALQRALNTAAGGQASSSVEL